MRLCEQAVTHLLCNRYSHSLPCEEDYTALPRPYFTLAYVISGRIECESGSRSFFALPGDILLIPFRSRYILRWAGTEETAVYSCHFNFPAGAFPFGVREFPLQKLEQQGERRRDFELLLEYTHREDGTLGAFSVFYRLLGDLYPLLESRLRRRPDERIARAARYLDEHYREDIRIGELAALSSLSPSRFHHLFRLQMDMTAIEYKNSLCVRRAALLLIDEADMPIEQVASEAGFHSPEYFRRVFRASVGMTPREYRRSMRA